MADVLIIDPSPNDLAAAQLIAWLATEHPTVRVVVLASTVPWAVRRQRAALGIVGYLEKLTDPLVLIQQLHGVLDPILQARAVLPSTTPLLRRGAPQRASSAVASNPKTKQHDM
jgi:DNA-binding NarL/FixJ family response regulator